MNRRHCWPDGHWNWPIPVSHKHGVRCGEMAWFGGQVDLTPEGEVLDRGDLAAQTRTVVGHVARVLDGLDCDLEDLVSLLCFYVDDGGDEAAFLTLLGDCLPAGCRTTVTVVPVPWLAYQGLVVEIEGIAMRREDGERMPRALAPAPAGWSLPTPFVPALRAGRMIFVSAQSPLAADGAVAHAGDIVAQTGAVMGRIEALLGHFGAGFGDVVKNNRWYAGGSGIADFEAAALACASRYPEPGPAATGIPLPRLADPAELIRIGVVAMLGEDGGHLPRRHVWPESLWDWHVHLPYKHGLQCGEMIFLGGQVSLDRQGRAVHPGDLSAQTHQAMQHIGTILRELGADHADVCKVTTFYQGDCGERALHENLPIRSSYFADPGPATTGIPLPVLAYDDMVIEIEVFAMRRPEG